MRWSPHVTVAAVIEHNNRFLIVEELVRGEARFNQPAGHWEPNESLIEAVIREVLEETAYDFTPTHLLGIYHWHNTDNNITYLRFAFCGEVGQKQDRKLDDGIIAAHWLSYEDIEKSQEQHRSPQVLRCIDDFLAGKRLPIDAIIEVS
ncbi:MAG: NUDIX hydrolase [Gammaproteobacteria bacterium]|nr:NUDIX hydrolase [Gammaproteobacteria bacterium]